MSAAAKKKKLTLTLRKGLNKRAGNHRACVYGLGLRRIGQTVSVIDTPAVRGMIGTVAYLLDVEEG